MEPKRVKPASEQDIARYYELVFKGVGRRTEAEELEYHKILKPKYIDFSRTCRERGLWL